MTQADELLAKMLKKPMIVMVRRFTAPKQVAGHLLAHLQWLIALEKAGLLFASGPFVDEAGKPTIGGMLILQGQSRAQAEALVQDDPFVKAGILTYELFDWRMSEGRIAISIDLSDQSCRLG